MLKIVMTDDFFQGLVKIYETNCWGLGFVLNAILKNPLQEAE